MPLVPALRSQRQVDVCGFETSLVYRVSSRTARAIRPCLEKRKINKQKVRDRHSDCCLILAIQRLRQEDRLSVPTNQKKRLCKPCGE